MMAPSEHPSLKILWPLSWLIILALGAAAWVFRDNRIYGDAALYLFEMVQREGFFIIHGRPSSVFIEWLPVLCIQQGASMSMLIQSLSLAEWIWTSSCFLLLAYGFRSKPHAIALTLIYAFGIRWNYFNPVSELLLAFPLFLMADLLWDGSVWKRSLALILAAFLLQSHVLYAFPLLLLAIWKGWHSEHRRAYLIMGLILVGLIVLRFVLLKGYDKTSAQTEQFGLKPGEILPKFAYLPYLIDLAKSFAGLGFLIVGLAVHLLRRKQWVALALILGFAFAYKVLVLLKFGKFYPDTFEPFERYLLPLSIGMVSLSLPWWSKASRRTSWVIGLLAIWHVFYLFHYGLSVVRPRYAVLQNMQVNATQFEANSVYFRKENVFVRYIGPREQGHDWTMGLESLLRSAEQTGAPTQQVFIKEMFPASYYTNLSATDYLYDNTGWRKPIDRLNRSYFHTRPLPWREAQSDSLQDPANLPLDRMRIQTTLPGHLKKGKEYQFPLSIDNFSSVPLFAGMGKERRGLTYRLYREGSTQPIDGVFLSPFMADVYRHVEQSFMIKTPDEPGNYRLEFCYRNENRQVFAAFPGTWKIEVE